jgi:hypothetical protein
MDADCGSRVLKKTKDEVRVDKLIAAAEKELAKFDMTGNPRDRIFAAMNGLEMLLKSANPSPFIASIFVVIRDAHKDMTRTASRHSTTVEPT